MVSLSYNSQINIHFFFVFTGAGKSGKSTLDEITNKVFEELLQGKPPDGPQGSDQGSVKVSASQFVCGLSL